MSCPVDLSRERNSTRQNAVPDSIINDMQKKLEPPDAMNCSWEHHTLDVNTSYNEQTL